MKTELEELAALMPSEIVSEVQESNDKETEDPTMAEGATTPDQGTTVLIHEGVQIGAEFKPAHEKLKTIIDRNRFKILALKEAFGVRRGCAGGIFIIQNMAFTWDEFIQTHFGVTSRRLNQLLDAKDEKDTNTTVIKTPDTDKALYRKGLAAGKAEAEREITAKLLTTPVPADANVNGASADTKGEIYAYFQQLKDEKQTFSSELAAMVLEMYDTVDAEEMSTLFVREIKKQLADARKSSVKTATA